MSRLKDKSFLLILITSIIGLIALIIGIIFLTRKGEKEFYSAGYIINSTATASSKLYFDDNTVYKENVFDEYVFTNKEGKEVTTSKENFIHYLDNSLSFMKNGVILDLDNFNETLVPYYNITDKSIIKYNNGGYYVETADKTLIFGNFLGRITDHKYIVVGKDVKIKLAGSDEMVSGNYFEILFVEDGIVKIENQEGSYQTISDGTVIYVGDDIKIDLGDKTVKYDGTTKLNLTEMTIDGNENIEITPTGKVKDEEETGTGSEGTGESGDTGEGGIDVTGNQTVEPTTVIKKEVSVDLVNAKVEANNITANFQVIDTADFIKGNLVLNLKNISTGETVYSKLLSTASDVQTVNIGSLSPDTNYYMTITEENNVSSTQYFQKAFKTESLDLSLSLEMATTDSLSYSLDFGTSGDIKSANIALYDTDNNIIGEVQTVHNSGDKVVTFRELTKNTTYNVRVDSVIFKNTNYASVYTINSSDTTLKEKPILGEISVEVDSSGQSFSLMMAEPTDSDNSITKYTYKIYDASKITEENINTIQPIYTFTDNELKTEVISVNKVEALNGVTDYRYKVVAEYYDNYKYNEIETGFSDYFQVVGKPIVEFIEDEISINGISGVVEIKDTGCTIPMPERECLEGSNNFAIRYYSGDTSTRKNIDNVVFTEKNNILSYDLSLTGLTENTAYTFEVYTNIDFHDGDGIHESQYIGNFTVITKGMDSLKVQNWRQNDYSYDTPISVSGELVSSVTNSESFDKLATVTFNLYRGDGMNTALVDPIGTYTVQGNIKSMYSNGFNITSNMLGIENLDKLREVSGDVLNRYYTIEITDAYDANKTNEFIIRNNTFVFETPSILLLEDEVAEPEIVVDPITNLQAKSSEYGISYNNKLGDDIIVGYKVSAIFEKNKMENYFTGSNPIRTINFYAYDQENRLIEEKNIDLTEDEKYTTYFYLNYGTEHNTVDEDLRRGNSYYFTYDISIDTNNDGVDDTKFPSNKPTSEKYKPVKQDPTFSLYPDNSNENSITYKYKITDYDNALYYDEDNYYFYYKIGDEEEEHKSAIEKSDDYLEVTLSNLVGQKIYSLEYSRASTKTGGPNKVNLNNYYFDGKYSANSYNLGYNLEYGNFDNRLKLLVADSPLLSRVSAYLVTLTASDDKYQTVVSELSDCDDSKCIIIDYADISRLKGKDLKVSLVAFYDMGYTGFAQTSKLASYFEGMELVNSNNSGKLGFVYQTTGTAGPGKYIYTTANGAYNESDNPRGILGFELVPSTTVGVPWKLTTTNIVDFNNNVFVPYGTIIKELASVQPTTKGIYVTSDNTKYTLNPKVLDKVTIQTLDSDDFKFTSITPKVTSTAVPTINGATINVDLSIDAGTLQTDFVKTGGKYKFYIDIYTKNSETNEFVPVKTVETDYENINEVTFTGLNPDTVYYYRISADMNKKGEKVKTELFDFNRTGYVVYQNTFATLNKEKILNRVAYNYNSKTEDGVYSKRTLNIGAYLKTKENFDVKYQIYDNNNNLEYEYTVANSDITEGSVISAIYRQDITGNDFVFGVDYHTLVVTAITTDLGKELELYNEKLKNDSMSLLLHELNNPYFAITPEAIIESDGTYSISARIVVNDEDKVIINGQYHIELQEATSSEGYINACTSHEEDCRATVNIITEGTNIVKKFTNLKPNTGYVIYVYADTYRNNLSLTEKQGLAYVRKTQYTKSDIGFSLGLVTPTAVSKSKLVVTFTGSSNLTSSLKGIEYSINVQGGEKIASGKFGKTSNSDPGEMVFTLSGEYPSIEITMPSGKYLGNNNYILMTYYYEDTNGDIVALSIGGKTVNSYGVIYNG